MSYILDALKRAERERKQGQISVLDELPAAQTAAPARPMPLRWIVLGTVAAVVLIVGPILLLRFHRAAPAIAPPAAPPVAVAPPPAPPAPAAQAAPPPAAQAKIEDGGSIATLDDVYGHPPPQEQGADEDQDQDQAADKDQDQGQGQAADEDQDQDQDQAPAQHQKAAAQPPPRPHPPSGGRPAAKSGPQTVEGEPPPPPVIDVPPEQPPASAQETPPAPHGEAAAPPRAALRPQLQAPANQAAAAPAEPHLQEMPESYRANFPTLSLDVLAYNSNPQRRFVLIGGKRYHEGDTIAEGPRIVSILAEGVVFDWQGQQVLYASGH